jgi:hypothetical protein
MVDVGSLKVDGTGETYYLDNFAVTDGPPAPPTPTPTHKKKCKKGKKRAVAAKKKCKKGKKSKKRRAAVATLRG